MYKLVSYSSCGSVYQSITNDPEKIGIHMLEMLAKFRSEGLFNVVVEDETDDDPGNGE